MAYNVNVITCLDCMNLVMCGRDIRGRVRIRCVANLAEDGRTFLLIDMMDRRIESHRGCSLLEKMREKRDVPWAEYLKQLRHNFCEVEK